MPDHELTQFQRQMLRTMRIIAFALIQGVLFFLAVASFIVISQPGEQPGADLTIMIWLPVGFAVVTVALRFVVPGLVSEAQVRRIAAGHEPFQAASGPLGAQHAALLAPPNASPAERLYPVYMTKLILGMALFEGAAFFALVAFIVTGHAVPLATAVVLLVLQVLSFPTRTRIEHWVETQLQTQEFVDASGTSRADRP